MASGSTVFLDALYEAGVRYVFANLGSDHPALIEAFAEAKARQHPLPILITCPTEMVALSAAHGFAQVSGRVQAVVVHVECGTQSLAGAMHNAAKGRIPVLIFAGASPFTQHGELKGSRNEFIQWIQDVHDQRGLVRGYVKYDNEFRSADHIREITHRALRLAGSDPKGPVYLMGAREIMEASADAAQASPWQPAALAALAPDSVERIARDLMRARRPLVVTSYLGRNPAAVSALVQLCDAFGIGVLESVPNYVNFPHEHALYQGNQWNEPQQNPVLAEADVVLVLDSDIPWIPLVSHPNESASLHHIDADPLKTQMPLAAIAAPHCCRADVELALRQIHARLCELELPQGLIDERRGHYQALHRRRRAALDERERHPGELVTPEYLTACVRRRLGEDALVVSEGVSNYQVIFDHLWQARPGALFTSGGGSLGWHGGAAIGAKLAEPQRLVVALAGDGSYLMSHPSSVHWMARRYRTPFLQIIYNNGGWKSPKMSALALHPHGYASQSDDIGVSFEPPADYAAIAAAAGGAFARSVQHPRDLDAALDAALNAVRHEGRAAVLDVRLPRL